MTTVYDKTDKGREEIGTRKYGLSPRLRPLLVMVDGKQPVAELLKKVAGLGLDAKHLAVLLTGGFIQIAAASPAAPAAAPAPSPASAPAPAPTAAANDASPENRFLATYRFYTETIKSTIGLRGYLLQMKVEKASTIDELRELRQPYLEAVLKAKGVEVAREMRARLDAVLGPDEHVPLTILDLRIEGE
jgi:hypothetical protein